MINIANKLYGDVYEDAGVIYRKDTSGFRPLNEAEIAEVGSHAMEEHIKEYGENIQVSIQRLLDDTAKKYRYNDMVSVRSYTGYPNAFQGEALKMATWATDCWTKASQIESEVAAGTRALPTLEEVLAEMPKFIA